MCVHLCAHRVIRGEIWRTYNIFLKPIPTDIFVRIKFVFELMMSFNSHLKKISVSSVVHWDKLNQVYLNPAYGNNIHVKWLFVSR